MLAFLTFLLVAIQAALSLAAFVLGWTELFVIIFVELSPVMLFFGGLQSLIEFSGTFPRLFFPALIYCMIKYVLLAVTLKNDPLGFFNVGALMLEIAYIALGGIYIVFYHNP